MDTITWNGIERRECSNCKELDELEQKVDKCKHDMDSDIELVHCAIADLKGDSHLILLIFLVQQYF